MANIATMQTSAAAANTNTTDSTAPAVERRCENADCNVIKLVSMVPKRKITQFITEPKVMDKPMLINGFTTVFQVDGQSAKLNDIVNPNVTNSSTKPIYRVVPNTHAHIVNYVVVDADGESLRKINESDPVTMRKLLESQKVSADQMLKKLMAGHGVNASNSTSVAANTTTTTITTMTRTSLINTGGGGGGVGVGVLPTNLTSVNALNARSTPQATTTTSSASSSIQLPMRVHPNLQITAVASAESLGTLTTASTKTTPLELPSTVQQSAGPTLPLITPVPLASLQCTPTATLTSGATTTLTGIPLNAQDKPDIDKMQAELAELRRTVALLAESIPKNSQPMAKVGDFLAAKRTRLN